MSTSFAGIPKNRLFIYLIVLGLVPALFVGLFFLREKRALTQLSQEIDSAMHTATLSHLRSIENRRLRLHYQGSLPGYLEKKLANLSFCNREQEELRTLMRSAHFTGDPALEKRAGFLSSKENRLAFAEGFTETADGVEEVLTRFASPIEVDEADLALLLERIEGEQIEGKPQLVVTDFHLVRKALPGGGEVYELDMHILKREFQS